MFSTEQPYLEKLYQALFAAAYYGLLRISEVTKGPHCVLARNVHLAQNKHKMLFLLETSKHTQEGINLKLLNFQVLLLTKKGAMPCSHANIAIVRSPWYRNLCALDPLQYQWLKNFSYLETTHQSHLHVLEES